VHYGSMAIFRPDGSALLSIGDNASPFFMRSTAKPFQTLAFLERGGADYYQLEDQEIALMCASHSGTPAHLEVLQKLQDKVGIREEDLQCGAHMPFHTESANQLLRRGLPARNNHNNCSGKHTGMLAFAKKIAAPLDSYLENDHPVQRAILDTLADLCGMRSEDIELGVDGCTAPVFGLPLPHAAVAYARLCQPEYLPKNRAQACRLITRAMLAFPFMVAGPQRFDTDAMCVGGGAFISKVGAEGYMGVGIIPAKSKISQSTLAMTIKISDGDPNLRAFSVVALAALSALGILDVEQLDLLSAYNRRPLRNWRDKEIGEIRPTRDLLNRLDALRV